MRFLLGRFAARHQVSILFLVVALCVAGGYASLHMPSAVFPQTDFPRVIIIVTNGVMPADEMMATITRPVEETMKEIPGCETIRSSTGRGTAEIDLFFNWQVDMHQSELYALGRIAQIRTELPATASTEVYRMTFSVFPIVGVSLIGPTAGPEGPDAGLTARWELAQYTLKPALLRIPGVARVDLVGGRPPEYEVVVDPVKLANVRLGLTDVTTSLSRSNLVSPSGLLQQEHHLFLTVVDGRAHSAADLAAIPITTGGTRAGGSAGLVTLGQVATVSRGAEPAFDVVTADGTDAVLLNIYSQPDGSTLDIANGVNAVINAARPNLPPGVRLRNFYDQALLVKSSVRGVWEAIAFGLLLSVAIVFVFLRSWRMTIVAIAVIPVTILCTVLAMKLLGQSFNLMTLGGIAAAVGLIIDDAIVVVEAIHVKLGSGMAVSEAIPLAMGEILPPLLGSTLTPVVVFLPLGFLTGVAGVFFRALAITMVVALLMSLILAVTLTPCLAAALAPPIEDAPSGDEAQRGPVMSLLIGAYQGLAALAIGNRGFTTALCLLVLAAAAAMYTRLRTDFLPPMDEGGFVIDYIAPPGTSLDESDRQMRVAERILARIPEVESYSRRTGTALGVHLVEPNTGDFLVRLRGDRKRTTAAVISDLRDRFNKALPRIDWEFPGILTDLIGDLTWSDEAIEVKLLSNDLGFLQRKAPQLEAKLKKVAGVVDTNDGLVYTGPTLSLRVRMPQARRLGLSVDDIGAAVNIAMLGQVTSSVIEADRVLNVRVKATAEAASSADALAALPIRAPGGAIVPLGDLVDITRTAGQLELERDDQRQEVSVTANLEGRDLGSAMEEVKQLVAADPELPPQKVEFGGLYAEQQASFRSLAVVLGTAIALVFLVALLEFGSFAEPIAIVFGAVVSVFGIVAAIHLTGGTLNIIAYLGAIIGMGLVHKNGLLMLDAVVRLREEGESLRDAILLAGQRRLRPVVMTSLAAALGMLPLAWGFGSADMLKPLAVAVIGALSVSVLLSLVATPAVYALLVWRWDEKRKPRGAGG